MGKQKLCVGFIGPVGSDKTYIAKILAKKLGALHINTDYLRLKLKLQGKPISRAIALSRHLRKEAVAGGKSVIADFGAVNLRRQLELKQEAKCFGAKFIVSSAEYPALYALCACS